MDEFKDKLFGNVRRFSRRIGSMRRKSSVQTSREMEHVSNDQNRTGSKLARSASARFADEKGFTKRSRPFSARPSGTESSSDLESFFQQTSMAIQSGQVSGLRRILQLNKMSVGVDINSFDKYGRTIVCHFAAKCPRKSINAMIEVLISEGADLDRGTRSEGLTPLMMAAQHKNCDVAILALLNHGADPNIVDYNFDSVLHWLESSNCELDPNLFEVRRDEARRNLLLFGARIDTKNSRGKTARDIIEQRTRKWEDEGIDMNSVNSEELPSVVSPIPFDKDDEDCDDGDFELESFSDEILDDDYQMRAYGKYQELDFYMERIVEIQEQLSLANH